MLPITYLLPIRSAHSPGDDELTSYLRWIGTQCTLVIVDGSEPDVFAAAHIAWSDIALHVAPDPSLRCANGKVHGVLTGLHHIDTKYLVIADDDVRYDERSLHELVVALEAGEPDVVVPQNFFDPTPWHARWDTGRTLLNRVTGGDFPGTLGLRTEALRATSGYDGEVLFENLELIRTIAAAGGRIRRADGLYVRRLPATTAHFAGQRVRQAYDEFARPARLTAWATVLPILLVMSGRRKRCILELAAGTMLLAELGRRRLGGALRFHWTGTCFAPLWALERAVCVWLAMLVRLQGGVPYAGRRLVRAGTPLRILRRRHAGVISA